VKRLLIVNSGLLGARTFGVEILPEVARHASGLCIEQIMLSGELTLAERAVRRAFCQRLWTDRWPALANLDFARYRAEWHAGLLAGRYLGRLDVAKVDALLFYRQPAAYASLARLRSKPSIIDIDCTQECIRASLSGPISRATLAPGIRHDGILFDAADLLVASSQWAASSVHALYPQCRTPIEVLPPPVRLSAFEESWMPARAARAARGQRPRVLFVGGEFPRKGGFALLRAWRDGGLAGIGELHLVTGWPLTDRDLPPGVVLHRAVQPYSESWRQLWRAADVFVMPARHEAFGMVFQEAAAAGLPRVGVRENAGPELIHDGVDGLLIDGADSHALVRALTTLMRDATLRQAMGRAARAFIVQSASIEVFASRLERLVEQANVLHRERAGAV
jgi:glycosyltransferase involved in cell wall biosynthesis